MERNWHKKIWVPGLSLILILVIWELFTRLSGISPLVLPSPSQVGAAFMRTGYSLFMNGWVTLLGSVGGFLIGFILAILMAIAFLFFPIFKRGLYPLVIAMRSVPVIALAPLVVVWVDDSFGSKITLAAIISFFPILVAMIQGLSNIEPDALELMKGFSSSPWQIFWKVRLPASLPSLFTGAKVASTFAVIGAVVAELVGVGQAGELGGIGYVIKSTSVYSETDVTFAAIIVAAIIGLLFFQLIALIERYVVFWENPT